ncbi:MAG: TrkH family potassium uptake protein [Vicinamibacteria bacterium]|nr:TrkH family potassium uptake protein [Vicinamibacteria bacterium]
MIRFATLAQLIGQFLLALCAAMLLPLIYGWATDSPGATFFLQALVLTLAPALCLSLLIPRTRRNLSQRDGLLLVVAAWFAVSAFGCLPLYFSPYFSSFTDAFFETVSGFTTTGATVLADVEVLPPPVQLWRCFTHWLGGMGIVLLGIAILPLVGHGGMQLYRAEFSGAKSEKLRPRVVETATALWKIYVALTLAQYLALRLAGMSAFDALCHTFATLGTGGFSSRTASIAAYDSALVEAVIIVFMLLAGVSFIQHHRLFVERRVWPILKDVEVRCYFALISITTAIVTASLVWHSGYGMGRAVRSALFQVSSILTTTGFVTDDYEAWHPLPQAILLTLMCLGGCTGSTAGGLKLARVILLARVVDREFKRMVERHGVFAVRLGREVIAESTIQSLLNLIYLVLVVNFASILLLAALGIDVLTAIAAVVACMFNIGPGLGGVGPLDNYGFMPAMAKWILCGCMIAGRLEFYTLLVILTPSFWRR